MRLEPGGRLASPDNGRWSDVAVACDMAQISDTLTDIGNVHVDDLVLDAAMAVLARAARDSDQLRQVVDRVARKVGRLHAENARLRAEVRTLRDLHWRLDPEPDR